MRSDTSKILVESPYVGRAWARPCQGTRRAHRQRLDPDGEGGPQRVGMGRERDKHFGEHLSPLYRWLDLQAGRPWAKVWGELCANLDRRNVVQAHLFQHIGDHVEIHTVWRDDQVHAQTRWSGLKPIAECWSPLFVHPRTGILLRNRAREIAQRQRRLQRVARAAQPHPDRRSGLPGMADNCQWQRIEGIWYEVTLAPLPAGQTPVFDVVLGRSVDAKQRDLLRARHGRPDRYAVAKQQLGRKALRAHGLACAEPTAA
ncbi:MAG: hypothetical protein QM750_19335 [Rubrivivax sp.]